MNLIEVLINTKGLGKISLDLEENTGELHYLAFQNIYYFPSALKLLIRPQTWSQDRGEDENVHDKTYLTLMGKRSALVWYNCKSQRTILHSPGFAILDNPINQFQDCLTKFHSIFVKIFKEPDRIHACATVDTPQQRERQTPLPPGYMVTDTE